MNIYVGIDPGSAGGVAVVDEGGYPVICYRMPDTGRDLLDMLRNVKLQAGPFSVRAVVEKVNAGVFGHGKARKMGVVSAFTFGRNVERVHMALLAAGIPFDETLPVKWQTALGCRTGGDKNVSKGRAQALFPDVTVTHAIADALLIAEFCRRINRGSNGKEGQGQGDAVEVTDRPRAPIVGAEEGRQEAKPARRRQGSR